MAVLARQRIRSKMARTRSQQPSTSLAADPADISNRGRSRSRSETRVDAKEAVDLVTASKENVFLFVPNLIGYARIIFAAISLALMPHAPKMCTALYFVSSILDVADGKAARALGQTSKFGAVLDMVTDRCATACLLCFLAMANPSYALVFQFLIALDFASHYMHMYSSLSTGSSSHKIVTADVSRILSLYYTDSRVLFIFCFCNETFFVALYLLNFYSHPLGIQSALVSSLLPTSLVLEHAGWLKVVDGALEGLSLPAVVAGICFPVMFTKQVINVVQFWKASKILVGLDIAERAEAKLLQSQKRG